MEMELAVAGSSVLYHLIPMEHAITAMQKDRFKLMATNEGVESEFGVSQYFLSLARSKHSDYFVKEVADTSVIFVLDGQKLGHNYEVKPVNYWYDQKHVTNDEKEDRLFANKMFIPCLRYIKEIHFMKEGPKYKTNDSLTLALLAKRAGIPLFQYDEIKAFRNLDKRKTIKLDVSDKKKRKFGDNEWKPTADYTLEAWYDASQIVWTRPEREWELQFTDGAKHKEQRKARRYVANTIRTLNKYKDVEPSAVLHFNKLCDYAKFDVELENLVKLKKLKRKLRVDTKGLLDYVRKRWMTKEQRELHGLE